MGIRPAKAAPCRPPPTQNHVAARTEAGTDHFQPQDLHGTDTEGHAYHGVGITRSSFSGSLVNSQFTETDVNNFYIVGTAGAPSYKVHETFHFTVNAKGNVTVVQDHLRITCS